MKVSGLRGLRVAVASLGVAVALAAAAITAFACTATAQISLGSSTAQPGSNLSGAGTAFDPRGSAVVVHFNGPSGPVLWSGTPASNGTIAFSFMVPQVAPGYYVIAATQTDSSGNPVLGSPARAALQVPAPSAQSPAPSNNAAPQQVAPEPAQQPAQSATAGATSAPGGGSSRSDVADATGQPAIASESVVPAAVPTTSDPRVPALGSLRDSEAVKSGPAAAASLPSPRHEASSGVPVLTIALVAAALLLAVALLGLRLLRRGIDMPGTLVVRRPASPVPSPSGAEAFVTWAEDVVSKAADGSSEDQVREAEAAVTRP